MEERQESPSLKEIINAHYAPFAETISPEQLATWVQTLEKIKAAYPVLWNTPLTRLEKSVKLCPDEAVTLLSLLPPLIVVIKRSVGTECDVLEEVTAGVIGMKIDETIATTLEMFHQLCRALYLAGYIDGQRNPEKPVLS